MYRLAAQFINRDSATICGDFSTTETDRNSLLSFIEQGNPQLFHTTFTHCCSAKSLILKDHVDRITIDGNSDTSYNPAAHDVYLKKLMSRKAKSKSVDNLLLFPMDNSPIESQETGARRDLRNAYSKLQEQRSPITTAAIGGIDELDIVICGTFRKDVEGLKSSFIHLKDLGFNVLSPLSVDIASEEAGFVYMRGEETETPENLELRHLEAIQRARLVWLHAPEGYVGPTAALEVGFARASGIPVFSTADISDLALKSFVTVVDSPEDVLEQLHTYRIPPPPPALKPFQNYYKQAAARRGYENESTQNCLLLMVEEVGELARALRKKARLTRHGSPIRNAEALELADVFMYVVHMANILKIDLGHVVQQKELLNIEKLLKQS